jgi:uncharacterized protein YbaR (Trm112 family)/SAM-dependent methyltransferase
MKVPLCCPVCKTDLVETNAATLSCNKCQKTYPVFNGAPVLINEAESVFAIADITRTAETSKPVSGRIKSSILRLLHALQKLSPGISLNLKAKKNYKAFSDLVIKQSTAPVVLVIGGHELGDGMEEIIKLPITFIETDIVPGGRTQIICDAHNLPFKSDYFDGVIIQAVMEYLVDPNQCADEIYRVLKPGAPVYAETPFMQQVHGREYDFMRFSFLGHRRLFRKFEEIASGACVGTGSALAWAYKYFILSFSDRKIVREFLLLFANWTGFWLKYFDYFTINKAATLDAASGYYFLGFKSEKTLGDKELVKEYRGMF